MNEKQPAIFLHTLHAAGVDPASIHMTIDAEIWTKSARAHGKFERQLHEAYDQKADELVDFILKRMPGGLVDAVFAKLAAHKAGLFIVPHVQEQRDATIVARISSLFAMLSSTCPHRVLVDCGHPKQDFNCMLCSIENCPIISDEQPQEGKTHE